jgi:hypothetical protein
MVIESDQLLLTQWILDELHDVIGRKWPTRVGSLDLFLDTIGYEVLGAGLPGVEIRDVKDQPILDSALHADVDIVITGDKDFLGLEIERPLILTARQYLDSSVGEPSETNHNGDTDPPDTD